MEEKLLSVIFSDKGARRVDSSEMSEFSGRCSVQRLQALYETRSESNTTDFTIVCQDGGVIPVHSFILSMGLVQ